MAETEYFISKEGTRYRWERVKEIFIRLTDEEVELIKNKVSQMSDKNIQNRVSGNGTPMGIPIPLERHRLLEIKDIILGTIKSGGKIVHERHAIKRIFDDAVLEENDPLKRGWSDINETKDCIYNIRKVIGVRLNVDYSHPDNSTKVLNMKDQFAFVIEGVKNGNKVGKLVLVILTEDTISVVTVL